MTFEAFEEDLLKGLADEDAEDAEDVLAQTRSVERSLATLVNQRAKGALPSPKDFGAELARMTTIQI